MTTLIVAVASFIVGGFFGMFTTAMVVAGKRGDRHGR